MPSPRFLTTPFVIVPVPYEATTSYGKGTRKGPAAILKALSYVEEFDEERQMEVRLGKEYSVDKPTKIDECGRRIAEVLKKNNVPVVLGGEHSIAVEAVKACRDKFSDLSVLQLDAHADLRDVYQGRRSSHACVMRRVLEICPAVQVGIRSISKAEWEFAQQSGQQGKIHWAGKIDVEKVVRQLSSHVYITVDADVFDPAVVPAVGTPEPGGLFWPEVLAILKVVCSTRKVVGFDVVELSPRKGDLASDFTIAKLVWKMMGYLML